MTAGLIDATIDQNGGPGAVLAAMEDLGRASQRRPIDPGPFVEAAGARGEAMGKAMTDVGGVTFVTFKDPDGNDLQLYEPPKG